VRTVLAWVNRFRRSFDQIRTEVRRELHNDEVLQKLKEESEQLKRQVHDTTRSVEREIEALSSEARESLQPPSPTADQLSSATAAASTEADAAQDDNRSPPKTA
jgi:Sec-independent protein translocase protein TatA